MFNIYYVHGYGSSSESKKFKLLQEKYEGIECLEWKEGENIKDYINNCVEKIRKTAVKNNNTNVIISSAIGSNFAMQMQFFLMKKGIGISMVMINPVFKINQIFDTDEIPNDVLRFLHPMKFIEDSLIIIGENDTVVDHNKIPKGITKNNSFVEVLENSHKLEDLAECFEDIDLYIVCEFYGEKSCVRK